LAASRSTKATELAPHRISFAKIAEPLEVPKLLDLQTTSFDWLVGNEAWKAQVARRQEAGEDVSTKSGLEEIFEEISPIEDFSGTMSLSFENPVFYPQEHRRGVQGEGLHLLRPALRLRGVHQQRDR
jgi:DNA-directed RNA polymerase subunit beta